MSFTGAVLLGGASRRYGSDKALALHNGRRMAQHAIDALQLAGAAEVVTVGGSNRGFKVPHWPDLYPGEPGTETQPLALGDLCQSIFALNEFIYVD